MANKLRNKLAWPSIMTTFNRLLLLPIVAFAFQSYTQSAAAQNRYSTSQFYGSWRWERYLTKEDLRNSDIEQLKRWAEDMDIKKTPYESLYIELTRSGDKFTGKCSSVMRFIDKLDGGEFSGKIIGRVAQFTMESSHGGIVTVRLTVQRNKLYWKIIKSGGDGDYWFPDKAILHRARRRGAAKPKDT
jgi:hypothetical protein